MKARVIDGLNAGRQFEENPTYFSAKKEALVTNCSLKMLINTSSKCVILIKFIFNLT